MSFFIATFLHFPSPRKRGGEGQFVGLSVYQLMLSRERVTVQFSNLSVTCLQAGRAGRRGHDRRRDTRRCARSRRDPARQQRRKSVVYCAADRRRLRRESCPCSYCIANIVSFLAYCGLREQIVSVHPEKASATRTHSARPCVGRHRVIV